MSGTFKHLEPEEVQAQWLAIAATCALITLLFAMPKIKDNDNGTLLTALGIFFSVNAIGFQLYNVVKLLTHRDV